MCFTACDSISGSLDWPTYTVIYHANDGTGRTETHIYRHGTSEYLNGMFYREGHTIDGWATQPDGEVRARTRAAVNDLITRRGQTINLYAVWPPNEYMVFYDPNGGYGDMSPSARVFGRLESLRENAFTNAPYTFHGWARSPSYHEWEFADGAIVKNLTAAIDGIVTLYALWGPQYITVTFHANGGVGPVPDARHMAVGSSLSLPGVGELYKEGHAFVGWSLAGVDMGETFTTRSIRDVTLYAVWSLKNFVITFNANNATGTPPSSQTVYAGGFIIVPGAAGLSLDGFTFGGWNTMADGMGRNLGAGETFEPSGNVTLYAIWHPIGVVFTVTFALNQGTGTPPISQTTNAGGNITIPAGTGLSRQGYSFGGWNTQPDGMGYNYSPGVLFTPNGNVTLYARWIAIFSVIPGFVDMSRGETRQFESTVESGALQNVEWTVTAAAGGILGGSTINQQGQLTVGANAFGTLIVRATVSGTDISSTATVNVAIEGAYLTITLADLQDPFVQEIQGPNINLRYKDTGTVTVAVASVYSITWFIGAIPLTEADGVSMDGATLTVGYAIHGNRLGTHRVTVLVEVLRDNVLVPYSRSIVFEVGTWLQ